METAWLSTEGLCQQHRASQQRLGGTISCMQAVRASSYSTWVCCSHLIHVFSLLTRESESGSVMANSLWPHEFRCLCLWNSLGKHTEVGCHTLLQGIFPNQRLKLGVLHCRQILCHLSHLGSPETPPSNPLHRHHRGRQTTCRFWKSPNIRSTDEMQVSSDPGKAPVSQSSGSRWIRGSAVVLGSPGALAPTRGA